MSRLTALLSDGGRRATPVLVSMIVLLGLPKATVGATPQTATITLSPTFGPPTTDVAVVGSSFGSKESVDVDLDGHVLVTAQTDEAGSFDVSLSILRAARPGLHTVKATGQSSGLVASAEFLVRTDWSEFQWNRSNTGSNPFENVLDRTTVADLHQRWSYDTESGVKSGPVVAGGIAYVNSGDYFDEHTLLAIDVMTHELVWSASIGGGNTSANFDSTPAVKHGVAYVASPNGKLYAFDAATGALRWVADAGNFLDSSPVLAGGAAIIGSENGNLYAFDAMGGKLLWVFETGDGIYDAPAVSRDTIFVGSRDGYLYAVELATGSMRWRRYTGETGSPAVAQGTVFVHSFEGRSTIYAFDAATGVMRWVLPVPGHDWVSAPAVSHGVVYAVGAADVFAIDADDGTIRWTTTTGAGLLIVTAPAVANGVVYVAPSDGRLYALDATNGDILFTSESTMLVGTVPAVSDGYVYVGSLDGNLRVFGLGPGSRTH